MRIDHENPIGSIFPSGPWRCRWVQGLRSGLEELCLAFSKERIRGTGIDADGSFEYAGSVYIDGTLSLTKKYLAPNIPVPTSMSYIGRWSGCCFVGQWIDDSDPRNNGPFKMWPGDGTEPGRTKSCSRSPEITLSIREGALVPVPTHPPSDAEGSPGR